MKLHQVRLDKKVVFSAAADHSDVFTSCVFRLLQPAFHSEVEGCEYMNDYKEKILKIIWWLYIAILFIFVVVKFKGSFTELSDRIHSYSAQGSINYNLIPFKSIKGQIEHIPQWWALKNLLGNTLPFIPFGFLLPIAYRKFNSLIRILAIGISALLLIEFFQLFTMIGSFDIDDIILNLLGIIGGYFMFLLINPIFIGKQ